MEKLLFALAFIIIPLLLLIPLFTTSEEEILRCIFGCKRRLSCTLGDLMVAVGLAMLLVLFPIGVAMLIEELVAP